MKIPHPSHPLVNHPKISHWLTNPLKNAYRFFKNEKLLLTTVAQPKSLGGTKFKPKAFLSLTRTTECDLSSEAPHEAFRSSLFVCVYILPIIIIEMKLCDPAEKKNGAQKCIQDE